MQGISTTGSHKVPNSVAHALHKHGHKHQHDHDHHEDHHKTLEALEEGYHHVDDLEKVVKEFMPEAKQIGRLEVAFRDDMKEVFTALKMDFFLLSVYSVQME